jgi:hypothetical protein
LPVSITLYSYRVREDAASASTGAIAMVDHLLSLHSVPLQCRIRHP